jgi:WD40 repeat protein
VVSAGADGAVQFHNVVTGEPAGILRAGDGIVNAIALSPDGTLVAAGFETGAVTIWEIATSRCETLPGHAGHVNDVAFSPHSRALASAGKDGTVRLWR